MKYRFKIIEMISNKKIKGKREIVEVEKDFPIEKLIELCRDFCADCNYDGFASNDESYIEFWLKRNS